MPDGEYIGDSEAIGVREIVLPTKSQPNVAQRTVESEPAFQDLVRWRTGCEGWISCLKRDFGWSGTGSRDQDLVQARGVQLQLREDRGTHGLPMMGIRNCPRGTFDPKSDRTIKTAGSSFPLKSSYSGARN